MRARRRESAALQPPVVYTLGYEQTTQTELIRSLSEHGVRTLIDVRDVANSRRAGFSKRVLAASLDEAGIAYLHLRALGTPKAGRIANRAGRMAEFWSIYEEAFQRPAAQLALLEAEEICRSGPAALMCYCSDGSTCHRNRIAEALESRGLLRREISFQPGLALPGPVPNSPPGTPPDE
jgi:uncharacterized protein (DUF488 family)